MRIQVSNFETGNVGTILVDQKPIVVWHGNADDMTLAKHQDDPVHGLKPANAQIAFNI